MHAGRRNYVRKGSGSSKLGLVLEEKTLRGLSRRLNRRIGSGSSKLCVVLKQRKLEGFFRPQQIR